MDSAVRQQLIELTAEFYRFHARSFDRTRQQAWSSWPRLMELLPSNGDLLDVGCGNGRFMGAMNRVGLSYTGVDPSPELVRLAAEQHPSGHFEVGDIEHVVTSGHHFDAVVCFGVLHHLPGRDHRVDALRALGSVLRDGGVLALSLWQPRLLDNIESKLADRVIDGLEADDLLLTWDGDPTHVRYCHHFGDAEIDELVARSELELVDRFQGTGNDRSNHYVILRAGRRETM